MIEDIGAGTGNYSRAIANRGFFIQAVEHSFVMRQQAIVHPQIQWFTGYAEELSLPTLSVDAVISILAIYHFSNLEKALQEMYRIAKTGAIILLIFDPRVGKKLWIADYFPSLWEDAFRIFPPLNDLVSLIQKISCRSVNIFPLMLPHNLTDLFFAAEWKRPEIYLNPQVRASISALALADVSVVEKGISFLKKDLDSGQWNAKYGKIKKLKEIDADYRFLCAKVA